MSSSFRLTLLVGLLASGAAAGAEGPRALRHESYVMCLAFSPDGKALATLSQQGRLRLWEVATGKLLQQVEHQGNCTSVAFSPDGKTLAIAGFESIVTVWDVAGFRKVMSLDARRKGIGHVTFSPDGRLLAVAGWNNGVLVWEAATGKERVHLRPEDEHGLIYQAAFSPDGRHVAAVEGELGKALVWELTTGRLIHNLDTKDRTNRAVAFAPDGLSVWPTSAAAVTCWDLASGRILRRREMGGGPPRENCLAYSADRRVLATSAKGMLVLWESASDQVIGRVQAQGAWWVALSADGTLASSAGDTVLLRDWWRVFSFKPDKPRNPAPTEMDRFWEALTADAARAYPAMGLLRAVGDDGVKLLRTRVKPAEPARQATLRKRLADLDDPRFARREQAAKELREAGPSLHPLIEEALKEKPSLEMRRQLERLLEAVSAGPLTGSLLRDARVVWVLELIGTPSAVTLLRELASGAPNALLTREASAALRRLNRPARAQ